MERGLAAVPRISSGQGEGSTGAMLRQTRNSTWPHLSAASGEGPHCGNALPHVMRTLLCSSPAQQGSNRHRVMIAQQHAGTRRARLHTSDQMAASAAAAKRHVRRQHSGYVAKQAQRPSRPSRPPSSSPVRTSCFCAASQKASPLPPRSSWLYGSSEGRGSPACSSKVARAHLCGGSWCRPPAAMFPACMQQAEHWTMPCPANRMWWRLPCP